MKKFLFNWFAGVVVILMFCFLVIGIPFLLNIIGLPDWVNVVYFFVLASIVLALTGMTD